LKKTYLKPSIESIPIDRDISLIMMTDENNPPNPAAAQPTPSGDDSFEQNPFSKE
jgi:hypothetical protein